MSIMDMSYSSKMSQCTVMEQFYPSIFPGGLSALCLIFALSCRTAQGSLPDAQERLKERISSKLQSSPNSIIPTDIRPESKLNQSPISGFKSSSGTAVEINNSKIFAVLHNLVLPLQILPQTKKFLTL